MLKELKCTDLVFLESKASKENKKNFKKEVKTEMEFKNC